MQVQCKKSTDLKIIIKKIQQAILENPDKTSTKKFIICKTIPLCKKQGCSVKAQKSVDDEIQGAFRTGQSPSSRCVTSSGYHICLLIHSSLRKEM